MRYPTIKFVFDRKHLATKNKTGLVQIEVLSERKRKWISTGIKLYVDQWNERSMVVNHPDMLALNKTLLEQRQKIQAWVDDLARRNEEFEFDKLDRFLAARLVPDKFTEYVERRITERADIKESTKKAQRKLLTSLNEYGQIIFFTDLTKKNILAYDAWLHTHEYQQTTVHSFHKFMKIYINDAIRAEIIERSPYDGIKIDRGKSKTRRYLTDEEVLKIIKADISGGRVERARDLFLFQCYTGFAYAELVNFDFTKVVERNGKYIVHDTRQKTDEPYYIVLLSPAVEILKKYDFKLPIIANQQYNVQLKALGTLAKLNKSLTSHMGRHTFAVMALNHGAKIENVAKMMGHTDIKTTQIYARVLNSEVEREFDMLEETLLKAKEKAEKKDEKDDKKEAQ